LENRKRARLGATLWFIGAALSLFAFGLTYSKDGRIKGSLLATTFFAAVMGFTALRSQKSDQL